MNQRNRTFRHVDPLLGEAVRTGTAWLDENYPGWADRVTRPVRIAEPTECVLGQVIDPDGHSSGFARFFVLHPRAVPNDLGFAVHIDSNMPGMAQFEMLDALWTEVVTSRRAAAAL